MYRYNEYWLRISFHILGYTFQCYGVEPGFDLSVQIDVAINCWRAVGFGACWSLDLWCWPLTRTYLALMAVCACLCVCMDRLSEICAKTHALLRLLHRLTHATKLHTAHSDMHLALASNAHPHHSIHSTHIGFHTIPDPFLCPTTVLFTMANYCLKVTFIQQTEIILRCQRGACRRKTHPRIYFVFSQSTSYIC